MKARASGDRSPLSAPRQVSLAQLDQSAGLRSRRSHVRVVHETPTSGCVAERPIAAACKAVSHKDTVVRIHPHPPCRASSTGRAAASKADGSRFDSVARCQESRRSQVAEGIWLQTRRRKPASVRIGPSSPGLVSSADESSRLLSGGSAVRIGHEAPDFFSPIAQMAERLAVNQEVRGSKPRRGAIRQMISCSSVAEQRLDKAQVDGSFPSARTRSPRCGADGSARASGAWGRRFETCRRDQTDVRLGVAVAQWQSRGT